MCVSSCLHRPQLRPEDPEEPSLDRRGRRRLHDRVTALTDQSYPAALSAVHDHLVHGKSGAVEGVPPGVRRCAAVWACGAHQRSPRSEPQSLARHSDPVLAGFPNIRCSPRTHTYLWQWQKSGSNCTTKSVPSVLPRLTVRDAPKGRGKRHVGGRRRPSRGHRASPTWAEAPRGCWYRAAGRTTPGPAHRGSSPCRAASRTRAPGLPGPRSAASA